jgi:hypothetical protein
MGRANLTRRRGDAEKNRKGLRGFTLMIADKIKAESETLAPKGESIHKGFFQPGTETAFGGFVGFSVVDLEGFRRNDNRISRTVIKDRYDADQSSVLCSNAVCLYLNVRAPR